MTSTQVTRGTGIVVVAAACIASITLAGCGGKPASTTGSNQSNQTSGIGQIGVVASPSASVSTGNGNGNGGGGSGNGSGSGSGGKSSPTPTKAGSSTTIVYFKVTSAPQCAIVGTTDAPFSQPAKDVTIAWKVTGPATGVALSIDDPTFFSRYGSGSWKSGYKLEDSETLSFPCDSSKTVTTHKYTINTQPVSGSKASTISVSASM